MKIDLLLGLQWGDEGKGKIVDVLSPEYDIIARFQGGPNAGHTLEFNGQKHILHTIPSGIFHKKTINVIGNGVIVDPFIFIREVDKLSKSGITVNSNLLISKKAHLILPTHRLLDAASEASKGKEKIGSTLKGIGPAYMDKIGRNGIRTGNLFEADFNTQYEKLRQKHLRIIANNKFKYDTYLIDGLLFKDYEQEWLAAANQMKGFSFIDSEYFINQSLSENQRVLAEGAQGTLLDIDFGSYPYVTSSNTISAGVCSGLGIPPVRVGNVFGVFKAYCTRVGSGPFPTELSNEEGEKLRNEGNEYGSTTGRPRRCGWLDLPALKYAVMINGVSELFMTKVDVLNQFDTIKICTAYEYDGKMSDMIPFNMCNTALKPLFQEFKGWGRSIDKVQNADELPRELKNYIRFIEEVIQIPVTFISSGPDRKQTIIKKKI